MNARTVMLLALALPACKAPPVAPEGLNASTSYMVREFYSDDETFALGITGFMDWFETGGGKELVGAVPGTEKPTDAFQVASLSEEDVAYLPLDDEIILEANGDGTEDDEVGPRDIKKAVGVVSVAVMDCSWKKAEKLLALPNQAAVFSTWEAYEREFVTSRSVFEGAAASDVYAPIPERLDPYAEGADMSGLEQTLLFTDNVADPAPVPLVGDLPAFPLKLEMRHGQFEIAGREEPAGVLAIITYAPAAYWGDKGKNGFRQSYSVELNVEQSNGATLRMLAVWNEPDLLGVDPSSDIAKTIAINTSKGSSDDLAKFCDGSEPFPEE